MTQVTESDLAAISLFEAIDAAHRNMTSSKAELLARIREFDLLGLAPKAGSRTTAQYLMRRFGVKSSTAYEYVNVAHKLGLYPYLEYHFSTGDISYSVVRLLLQYLAEDNERELVDMAVELGYHELEVALCGKERKGDSEKQKPQHYLRLHEDDEGNLHFHGCLNPADGAAFKAGLKLGEIAYYDMDELFKGEDDLDAARTRAENLDPVKPARQTASGYGLPIGRILVKALMGMVHMVRATKKNSLLTPAAHVNVVATHDGRAYMPNNVAAPSSAIAGILANASFRLSTVGDDGLVLNTGRSFRLANPSQINALMVMWGGQCAAPGCTHTRFMEMHHIQDWADGGHTDLENLLPLCSACHSLVSEGYLRTVKDGPDIHFIYADGTRFVSYNYSLPRRRDHALTAQEFEQCMNDASTLQA